jgi:propionyl-CoA carboxylase alpha chain
MFRKILIANRGEIACRILATARRLGIATVAVYSEADRNARHVEMADEALPVGPAPAAESYLRVEAIVDACRRSGAEAVHPGYGFLSENAALPKALDAAGVRFIGPAPEAIVAMGDKITSKRLAEAAGVSVIPGHDGEIRDAAQAVEVARSVGYPVMLKASAGGGGKGMRVARDDAECREGYLRATSEARSSFGDERLLIERYVERPRHIEIQILADAHGNVVHLGERECSIQRRHQKVIEEAPSPFLDPETRAAMGAQAVALARAVEYRSAGTVEFIVDPERRFYFLEMNTRLQVEHPVTEAVTGLDLVELMIRVAAGEPLPFGQEEVRLSGWAVEARIYAEDPVRGFLPSSGRLVRYREPAPGPGLRVDSGVGEGDEVSVHYDPMIAKLIASGATREEAVERLARALDEYHVRGLSTNISFLASVAAHPRFRAGLLTTGFVEEEWPEGWRGVPGESVEAFLIPVAAALHRRFRDRAVSISGQMPGFNRETPEDWVVVLGGRHHPCRVVSVPGGHAVHHAGREYDVRGEWRFGDPLLRVRINGELRCLQVERGDLGYRLYHGGVEVEVLVLAPRVAELHRLMPARREADTSRQLLAPMPGLLLSLAVGEGDEVKAGQELAVIEAMKMENQLRAERDARVAVVLARPGDSLAVDQPILEFE